MESTICINAEPIDVTYIYIETPYIYKGKTLLKKQKVVHPLTVKE